MKEKKYIRCDNDFLCEQPEHIQAIAAEIGVAVLGDIISGNCHGIIVYAIPHLDGKKIYVNVYDDIQDCIRAAALGAFSDGKDLKEVMHTFKIERGKGKK